MSHWSRDVQPPLSKLRRDSYSPEPRHFRFVDPEWTKRHSPVIEERFPQRGRSSICERTFPRCGLYAPVPEDYRPRRRSSSSSDDYPHYYHTCSPAILLPPDPERRERRSSKKKLYFVRPHDGRPKHRRGTLGRLKDALTGEGPDVFVTATTRERRMRDRPQRWQWSGYEPAHEEVVRMLREPGFASSEFECVRESPWTSRGLIEGYDFNRRRYGGLDSDVWTDARWVPSARRGSRPVRVRDGNFQWRWVP